MSDKDAQNADLLDAIAKEISSEGSANYGQNVREDCAGQRSPKKRKHNYPKIRNERRTIGKRKTDKVVTPENMSLMGKKIASAALYAGGARLDKIAKDLSISKRSALRYISEMREVFPTLDNVEMYTDSRSKLLTAAEDVALQSAMQKLRSTSSNSLREIIYAFSAFHSAGRLERNLSTSNVQSHVFRADFEAPSAPDNSPLLSYNAAEDNNDR